MTKDEALKLALEALQNPWKAGPDGVADAIIAIKEVLAQPEPWEKFCDSNCVWTDHHPDCKMAEQEPVAKFHVEHRTNACSEVCDAKGKVYATCDLHIDAGQRAERICNLLNTTQSQQELVCVCGAVWEGQELIYTTPQRTWVGLTDEDFQPMVQKAMAYYGYKPEHSTLTSGAGFYALVRNIEAKLKERNTCT